MRITGNKALVLEAVQNVIGAVGTKNTLPILSNILIEAKKEVVLFSATDLDIGITYTTNDIQCIEEGSVTIPAKRTLDIIKELPNDTIEITAKKNNTVLLQCGDIIFKILGIPKDEFPTIPGFKNQEACTLTQKELRNLLTATSFAMSSDETRYILNGICIAVSKETIKTIATDGRRLAIATIKNNTNFKKEEKAVIPSKAVGELIKTLKEEKTIDVFFSEKQIKFQTENMGILSRLIEGEFPNYEQAIPKEHETKLIINKEALQSAVKRASLLTTQESQAIKLALSKNKLIISKSTPEIGETKEELTAEYTGPEMATGFNPTYLQDVLKTIKKEKVSIEFTGTEKPAVIRQGGEYIYIVLPMQVT